MSTSITVDLVDIMGNDLFVANVARVSFNKWKEEFDQGDARLIDYLASHEHLSPFRHTCISLRCKAPVFLARQLGKHQAGLSWNEVSRRYVDTGIEFFVPDSWRGRPVDGIKQGSGEVSQWSKCYDREYRTSLAYVKNLYYLMIEDGIAPEMARMVLPQSMMVDWVWTGNLLAFFHVYRLRAGEGAQLEAKMFAEQLGEVIEPLFPECWRALKGDKHEATTN